MTDEQRDYTADDDQSDLRARSSAAVNGAASLLEYLTRILGEEAQLRLQEIMQKKHSMIGLVVLFGSPGTLPVLRMVGADADGENHVVLAGVTADGIERRVMQ